MPCSNGTCQEYLLGGHLELQELGLSTQDVPGGMDLQEPDSRDVGLRTGFMVYSHIDPIGRKLFCCLPLFAFTFRAISRRFSFFLVRRERYNTISLSVQQGCS
jgi:hypothetical protein